MKNRRYYIISCITFPLIAELCSFIPYLGTYSGIEKMNFIILATMCSIAAVIIGTLSPSNKLFDYALPIVSVISYNCYRFICGFFAKTDLETRFSILEAIDWIFVDTSLLLSAVIAVITFLASFKYIKISNIFNNINKTGDGSLSWGHLISKKTKNALPCRLGGMGSVLIFTISR